MATGPRLRTGAAFFDALADATPPGLFYMGTMLPQDGSSPTDLTYAAPSGRWPLGGHAFWLWPAGHCLNIPAHKLATASSEDLDMLSRNEHPRWRSTYTKTAELMGYEFLGHISHWALEEYVRCPGTVGGDNWR